MRFEKISVSTETIFAGDRVFEDVLFQRHGSEAHIGTEEDKEPDRRDKSTPVRNWWEVNNGAKSKLGNDNSHGESGNVNKKNWFFADASVRIKDKGDKKGNHEKTCKLGGEIVGIVTVEKAVHQAPEQSRSDGDFDVLPGGFVDGSKKAERLGAFENVVKKVS